MGGSFDEGVALWVVFPANADQGAVDAKILELIKEHLPADVPFERVQFRGFW